MATRGRKPKHPGLELLDGGRGKKGRRPLIEVPTEYPAMRKDFEHAALWAQLHGLFEENGTPIRSSDVFAIEELCSMIATVRYIDRALTNGTLTTADRMGNIRSNPLVSQLKATRDALWRGFERFGMTPVDSGRLPLKSKVKTPREQVMQGFDKWNRKQDAGQGMRTGV